MRTVFEAFTATARTAPDHPFLAVPAAPGRAYHPDGVALGLMIRPSLLLRADQVIE